MSSGHWGIVLLGLMYITTMMENHMEKQRQHDSVGFGVPALIASRVEQL